MDEDNTTIYRFFTALSFDITNRVELIPYRDINAQVQIYIKVESQILRKSSKKEKAHSSSYPNKDYQQEENFKEKSI